MTRTHALRIVLICLTCFFAFSLQASAETADLDASITEPAAEDAAAFETVTTPGEKMLQEAAQALACEAPVNTAETADLLNLTGTGLARQCTSDKQCEKVCPCLPQCVDGYCANCLWCPPTS